MIAMEKEYLSTWTPPFDLDCLMHCHFSSANSPITATNN